MQMRLDKLRAQADGDDGTQGKVENDEIDENEKQSFRTVGHPAILKGASLFFNKCLMSFAHRGWAKREKGSFAGYFKGASLFCNNPLIFLGYF